MCGAVTCEPGVAATERWCRTGVLATVGHQRPIDGGQGQPEVGLGLGVKLTVGVALLLGQVLPGGTWQSAGATIRGSFGVSNTNESATVTSD